MLGTPPAFVLSQDQTLQLNLLSLNPRLAPGPAKDTRRLTLAFIFGTAAALATALWPFQRIDCGFRNLVFFLDLLFGFQRPSWSAASLRPARQCRGALLLTVGASRLSTRLPATLPLPPAFAGARLLLQPRPFRQPLCFAVDFPAASALSCVSAAGRGFYFVAASLVNLGCSAFISTAPFGDRFLSGGARHLPLRRTPCQPLLFRSRFRRPRCFAGRLPQERGAASNFLAGLVVNRLFRGLTSASAPGSLRRAAQWAVSNFRLPSRQPLSPRALSAGEPPGFPGGAVATSARFRLSRNARRALSPGTPPREGGRLVRPAPPGVNNSFRGSDRRAPAPGARRWGTVPVIAPLPLGEQAAFLGGEAAGVGTSRDPAARGCA